MVMLGHADLGLSETVPVWNQRTKLKKRCHETSVGYKMLGLLQHIVPFERMGYREDYA